MAKLRLDPNVPVLLDVKYADLIDSQYGVQLRMKGSVPGDRNAVLYVDVAHAEEPLLAAGVLAAPFEIPDPLPENGLDVKRLLRVAKLVVGREQRHGEKTARFTVRVQGQDAAAVATPNGASEPPAGSGGGTERSARKTVAAIYLECVDFALGTVKKRFDAAELPLTDAGAASIVATLFIQRCREER